MSAQSGITASEALLSTYNSLSNLRPLVIRLSEDNTTLVEDETFSSGTGSNSNHFESVSLHLSSSHPHPAYLIIPIDQESSLFASFIPDEAPIREKMLYASTKSTLLTQLGLGNFKKSHVFAWSELPEVSLKNFNKEIASHAADNDLLLTEEERLLNQINSLQSFSIAETNDKYKRQLASMDGTPHSSSTSSLSSAAATSLGTSTTGVMFKIDNDLEEALNSFATPGQLLAFKINLSTETVHLTSSETSVKPSTLISHLTASASTESAPHPQYALFHYSPKKVSFIYSCPSGSKVKERMVYASNKKSLLNHIKLILGAKDLTIDKSFEVGDLDELELSEFDEQKEDDNASSTRLKFNKPKGPRRR